MDNQDECNILNEFAKNIKELRESLGMTQKEVAEMSGVSRITYLNVENGKASPSWKTIKGIADTFKVNYLELLGSKEDRR